MSKAKKTIGLDKIGIESLSLPEKDKQFIRTLIGQLEQMHRDMREIAESFGSGATSVRLTTNWKIIESGNNLEFRRDTTAVFPTSTKKGAITG